MKRRLDASHTLQERLRRIVEGEKAPVDSIADGRQRAEARRAERAPMYNDAFIDLGGVNRMPVELRNLSTSGARIEFIARMRLPTTLSIVVPSISLRRQARVASQGEGIAGLAFLTEAP